MVVVCCELTHFKTISLGFGEMVFVYLCSDGGGALQNLCTLPKKRVVQSVCREGHQLKVETAK